METNFKLKDPGTNSGFRTHSNEIPIIITALSVLIIFFLIVLVVYCVHKNA